MQRRDKKEEEESSLIVCGLHLFCCLLIYAYFMRGLGGSMHTCRHNSRGKLKKKSIIESSAI